MKVLNTLPQADLRTTAAAAIAAEQAGYDGVLTMENKHDPFLAHAIAAVNTDRIELGTSVAIAFPRSPMVVANASWDLQNASRGRFVLGIGPQIKPHNERRFSVPWSAPAPRLREYVQALRAIWTTWETGEKLDFRGEHYTFTLMPPYFMPPSMHRKMVPITLAGVGEHTLRLAGEVGDGIRLHGFCTRRYMEEMIMPRLSEGMARTGRMRAHLEVTGGGFVATGKDPDAVAKAFEAVRNRIGFYGSTPAYWGVFELHGYGDLGRELNAMSKAGQWNEMPKRIPDELVHLFAAVGTHKELPGRIAERFGGLSDAINLRPDSTTETDPVPPDVIQEIRRIATPFQGYRTAW
ncbi:MAG TPA: TIGR03617 family F420-dependent LLM class oxidoreductase [Rhodopila sp.]|uniref:TIGR03617 family F420-dependent LLM class oxidoreductase n=1 Tax=Rhodopila sp. TaxID=2480087 RepID=UPI002BED18F7|nr:TIGR03617 family F420-dependent LLM class oxidoreductase [Rhodopila sp.]HVY15111.1 TIGR03617 family F420-dependent LLM class oxidoreductase [Rhodopila sp.]